VICIRKERPEDVIQCIPIGMVPPLKIAQINENRPRKPAAKSMTEALRAVAESLSNLIFAAILLPHRDPVRRLR
jgi:hypothetical protein